MGLKNPGTQSLVLAKSHILLGCLYQVHLSQWPALPGSSSSSIVSLGVEAEPSGYEGHGKCWINCGSQQGAVSKYKDEKKKGNTEVNEH